jgi:hypothetical protein
MHDEKVLYNPRALLRLPRKEVENVHVERERQHRRRIRHHQEGLFVQSEIALIQYADDQERRHESDGEAGDFGQQEPSGLIRQIWRTQRVARGCHQRRTMLRWMISEGRECDCAWMEQLPYFPYFHHARCGSLGRRCVMSEGPEPVVWRRHTEQTGTKRTI